MTFPSAQAAKLTVHHPIGHIGALSCRKRSGVPFESSHIIHHFYLLKSSVPLGKPRGRYTFITKFFQQPTKILAFYANHQ